LLGAGGALFAAPPDWDPFRFRRLLAGLWDSEMGGKLVGVEVDDLSKERDRGQEGKNISTGIGNFVFKTRAETTETRRLPTETTTKQRI
jgi:hypothetical protein